MNTPLTIHLREDLRRYVEREVASGRFASQEEVVEAALETLAETSEPIIEPTMTIREAVAEALVQVERGEVYEVTDALWAEIEADAHAAMLRGDPVRDEVKY